MKNSEKRLGLSLIVVLAALIVSGFIAGAMIKLSSGDQLNNVNYASSATARSAANSGIVAAIKKIETSDPKVTMIPMLQDWINAASGAKQLEESNRWLAGSASTYETLEGAMKFRAKIIGFDKDNFNISIVSEGVGKGGSRATATTIYHIDGLDYERETGVYPVNAIHLEGDDNFEMNCSLVVRGDVYFGGQLKMFNKGFLIDGNFRMKNNTILTQITHSSSITGLAYWGGPVDLNATLELLGPVGFEKGIKMSNGGVIARNGAYANGYVFKNGSTFKIDNSVLTYWKAKTASIDTNVTKLGTGTIVPSDDSIPILSKLGFPAVEPQNVFFNYDLCNTAVSRTVTVEGNDRNLTTDTLNAWYDADKTAGKLLNGEFMVVRINQNSQQQLFSKSGSAPFNGKAIFLFEGKEDANLNNMIETTDDAIAALWIRKASINYGPMDNFSRFRGLIYVNSGGLVIKTQSTGSYIQGAEYHREGAAHKYENNGGDQLLSITFDPDVIARLGSAGVFSNPGTSTSSTSVLTLKKSYKNLETDLISHAI